MFKILVATDGSKHSQKVIKEAIEVAQAMQAEVTVLTVEDWTAVDRDSGAKSKEALDRAVAVFEEKGFPVTPLLRKGAKSPADVIIEVAKEFEVNLIILGSRGLRGFQDMLLGGVSNRVVQLADRNVMVIK